MTNKITIEIEDGTIHVSTRVAASSVEAPLVSKTAAMAAPGNAAIPADVLAHAAAVNATNGGPAPSIEDSTPANLRPPAELRSNPAESAGAARAESARN
jgi:hypothetical protein